MDSDPRDEHLKKAVGMNIRLARVARGMSQEELAHQAGLHHQSVVSDLERGASSSRLVTYVRVARALEMPLGQLFAGLDDA